MRTVSDMGSNVPAFLTKLLHLVNNSETNHLIKWVKDGKTFIIQNKAEFSRDILPLYYKHNNMASFIRQLNMYGFHKVVSTETGSLLCEKDEMEFSHPCFLQGRPSLLENIKRKITNHKGIAINGDDSKPELVNRVLSEVKQMKGRQESMDARFSVMKQENEALWREVAVLRQKHIKQQQIVNNLIQFLMSLVQPARGSGHNPGVKRKYQLMINNLPHNSDFDDQFGESNPKQTRLDGNIEFNTEGIVDELGSGPIIHELADHDLPTGAEDNNEQQHQFITVEVPALSPAPMISSPLPYATSTTSPGIQTKLFDDLVTSDDSQESIDPNFMLSFKNTTEHNPISTKFSTSQKYPFPINHKKIKSTSSVLNTIVDLKNANSVGTTISSPQPSFSVPATPILPNDIFAEDESAGNSDRISAEDRQAAISALQSVAAEYVNSTAPPSTDEEINDQIASTANYLSSLTSGSYGSVPGSLTVQQKPNESKSKWKNKKKVDDIKNVHTSNIKREILNENLDSASDHNMTLVSVDKDGQPISADDVDDHLESMQSDLESLRELLRGDSYSLDANALLGVCNLNDLGAPTDAISFTKAPHAAAKLVPKFTASDVFFELFSQDDPFCGLTLNNDEENINKEKEPTSVGEQSGQLMWYVPPTQGLDFEEMSLLDGNQIVDIIPESLSPLAGDSTDLNTPQVEINTPPFNQNAT